MCYWKKYSPALIGHTWRYMLCQRDTSCGITIIFEALLRVHSVLRLRHHSFIIVTSVANAYFSSYRSHTQRAFGCTFFPYAYCCVAYCSNTCVCVACCCCVFWFLLFHVACLHLLWQVASFGLRSFLWSLLFLFFIIVYYDLSHRVFVCTFRHYISW